MRLLPRSTGWVAYVWLVYLLNLPLVVLVMEDTGIVDWVWMAFAIVVFLPLYFLSHWVNGRRLLGVIAAVTLLAIALIPVSPGANVFFIYAAGMAGGVGRPRLGAWTVIGVLTVTAGHAAFARYVLAWNVSELLYVYLPALLFGAIIGAANIFYADRSRQNAQLRMAREEVERMAKIAERERIARDLHDLLGHTLSMITLKAELASRLADQDPRRAAVEMREVEDVSRKALAEVRDAVRGYRSTGLQDELNRAERALRSAGVACEWYADRLELDAARENTLSLALREAVTNVVRHAEAGRCAVRLEQRGEEVRLTVKDDGRGGVSAEGVGLTGMRERIEGLGGTLRVTSAEGTVVTVRIPLRPKSSAADPAAFVDRPLSWEPS